MTRDPLLPVRLVDGVWITEGVVEIAGQTYAAKVTLADRPPTSRPFPCFPDPGVFATHTTPTSREVTIPVTLNADDWRDFANAHNAVTVEHNPDTGETAVSFDAEATRPGEEPIPVRVTAKQTPPRRIFALVALDGSGVWAIGDSAEEARAGALDHRDYFRDCARSVNDDFPPPETDAAWLDTLALVTLSGTTESLRATVKALDDAIPWCHQDLWDNPEPAKES